MFSEQSTMSTSKFDLDNPSLFPSNTSVSCRSGRTSLGQVTESGVLISTFGHIYVRIHLHLSVQSVSLAVFLLQFEMQSKGQNYDQASERTTNSAAFHVKWSIHDG